MPIAKRLNENSSYVFKGLRRVVAGIRSPSLIPEARKKAGQALTDKWIFNV